MGKVWLEIEGINPFRAAEKLRAEEILLFSVKKAQKNVIIVALSEKELQKAFAILSQSCYNVKNVTYRGWSKMKKTLRKRAGGIVGLFLAVALILYAQTLILSVRIQGSGDIYSREITRLLAERGVKRFGRAPAETASLSQAILSLPDVSFCSVGFRGGVLTVTVFLDEEEPLPERKSLLADCDGVVSSLLVIRGTPVKGVGEKVKSGEVIVAADDSLVMARVEIEREISVTYPLSEPDPLVKTQFEWGEGDYLLTRTEEGYLVTGKAKRVLSLNLT